MKFSETVMKNGRIIVESDVSIMEIGSLISYYMSLDEYILESYEIAPMIDPVKGYVVVLVLKDKKCSKDTVTVIY